MNNDEILRSISRSEWEQLTKFGKEPYNFNIVVNIPPLKWRALLQDPALQT